MFQEQEEEKEQEIEIEKFVDLGYSREDEKERPWNFRDLLDLSRVKLVSFYALSKFSVW